MEYSRVQLTDLPDEILMIIFKKLCNMTLLYSLTGVNKRLSKIIRDPVFTNHLTLVCFIPSHLIETASLLRDFVYPLIDPILDRYCLQILPSIHQKIQWLCLEPLSMERILRATDYPNLRGLTLFNIKPGRAIDLFSDETILTCTLKSQLRSVTIDINTNEKEEIERAMNETLFTHILTTFGNLRFLNLGPNGLWCQQLFFDISPPDVISSTLLELYLCLQRFSDCLYILDGRFSQLRTFDAKINLIESSRSIINDKAKLPSLRSFTLRCRNHIECYEKLLLPLLHRMSNLEKVDLSLIVWEKERFLDGNHLKLNIVNHLPFLKIFLFNIRTNVSFDNEKNLSSNEDIQRSFKDFLNEDIISCVDHFPQNGYSQCHIYSYPYKMKVYENLTNRFPGGLFQCVREVSLFDEQPFEHTFFLRISQSFPFLEWLTVYNQKAQKEKQFEQTKDQKKALSIIKYPRLLRLDLIEAHQDYHEQFLSDRKTSLPNGLYVAMDYQFVREVTRNFRRNSTRNNCTKIRCVSFHRQLQYPEHLRDYFPCVDHLID